MNGSVKESRTGNTLPLGVKKDSNPFVDASELRRVSQDYWNILRENFFPDLSSDPPQIRLVPTMIANSPEAFENVEIRTDIQLGLVPTSFRDQVSSYSLVVTYRQDLARGDEPLTNYSIELLLANTINQSTHFNAAAQFMCPFGDPENGVITLPSSKKESVTWNLFGNLCLRLGKLGTNHLIATFPDGIESLRRDVFDNPRGVSRSTKIADDLLDYYTQNNFLPTFRRYFSQGNRDEIRKSVTEMVLHSKNYNLTHLNEQKIAKAAGEISRVVENIRNWGAIRSDVTLSPYNDENRRLLWNQDLIRRVAQTYMIPYDSVVSLSFEVIAALNAFDAIQRRYPEDIEKASQVLTLTWGGKGIISVNDNIVYGKEVEAVTESQDIISRETLRHLVRELKPYTSLHIQGEQEDKDEKIDIPFIIHEQVEAAIMILWGTKLSEDQRDFVLIERKEALIEAIVSLLGFSQEVERFQDYSNNPSIQTDIEKNQILLLNAAPQERQLVIKEILQI